MPRLLYPWERHSVPIVQEAGWALGPTPMGAENIAFIGIQSPDSVARSEELYSLCYLAFERMYYHNLCLDVFPRCLLTQPVNV
jgi:hypothetical protein